ncbi:MAG: PilZ domain-containing protein [Gammaproteobacteria bacterium]
MLTDLIELHRPHAHRRPRAEDKRAFPRLGSEDRLFAQVIECINMPELVGATVACQAVDVSIGGLQFTCKWRIDAPARLDLWVESSDRPGRFFLVGEVRWCRPHPAGSLFNIGVQLRAGAASDFVHWRGHLGAAPAATL